MWNPELGSGFMAGKYGYGDGGEEELKIRKGQLCDSNPLLHVILTTT